MTLFDQQLTAIHYTFAGIIGLLLIATVIGWVMNRSAEGNRHQELVDRIRSWWVMIFIFGLAIFLSNTVSIIFLGLVAFLALKEFFSAIPTRRIDRLPLLACYLAVPIQFYWVSLGWFGMFIIFIPLYMFLLIP